METIANEQATHDTDSQITLNDTGWTDAERERMQTYGYDNMDMLRAWFD
ncbi:hypothetical protein [Mailhella sp.]